MELFKLFGSIGIHNKDANKAIDETTGKAEQSRKKFADFFGAIGNLSVKAGKAMLTGLAVGVTALATLTGATVKNYAEYEQLVGGVETLFGAGGKSLEEYAASVGKSVEEASEEYSKLQSAQEEVMAHARQAYKTTGLSANAYMETVTGFSASLIKSLGGDTKKAACIADQAVIDMSDNANKMGSSMESIQNAYQGFAKQNYTMLDNLKLGYGGTKEEMQRLLEDATKLSGIEYNIDSFADVTEAIHVMQVSMGIAGTTFKEGTETISGSISMMKAAWTDFLTGMADPEQDFNELVGNLVESVNIVLQNIVPRIVQTLPRIVKGISQVAQSLASYLPPVLKSLLPALINGATELLGAFVTVIPPTLKMLLIDVLPQISAAFIQLLDSVFSKLPKSLQGLKAAYENIKNIFVQLGGSIASFFSSLTKGENGILIMDRLRGAISSVSDFIGNVTGKLLDFIVWFKKGRAGVDVLKSAIVGLTAAWTGYKTISTIIKGVEAAKNAVLGISNGLMLAQFVRTKALTAAEAANAAATMGASGAFGFFNTILSANPIGIIVVALAALTAGLVWFFTKTETGKKMWANFVTFLHDSWGKLVVAWNKMWSGIKAFFVPIIKNIIDFAKTTFGNLQSWWSSNQAALRATFEKVWSSIQSFIQTVMNVLGPFIQGAWKNIQIVIATAWDLIKNNVQTAMTVVSNIIKAVMKIVKGDWTGAWQSIKNAFTAIWNGMKNSLSIILQAISRLISSTWNTVKSVISGALNSISGIVSSVWNRISGIVRGVMSGISGTVSGIWGGIRNTISSAINSAKNAVASAIGAIKGFMNFSWSIPRPKLPRFNISGGEPPWGFMGKGSLPRIDISWFAKGGIMTKPTLFGINGNRAMVGGEAGAEAVLPLNEKTLGAIGRAQAEAAGNAGNTFNFNITVNGNVDNPDEMVEKLARKIEQFMVREAMV